MRVLVCDDSAIVIRILYQVFTKEGHDTAVATDGEEALELIVGKEEKFDLVVIDLNMPVISGQKACEKIRQLHPHLPIFALTATQPKESLEELKQLGFTGFCMKPINIEEIQQILKKYDVAS